MNKFVIAFLVFSTINVVVGELTIDQLAEVVNRACPEDKGCPQEEYGIFDEFGWSWNYTAIQTSKQSQEMMRKPLNKKLFHSIKSVYCCQEGPCAKRCIVPKKMEEIDIVQNFPENARELLSLNFQPFYKFREVVMKFVKDWENGLEEKGDYPAEIEDFLDLLHRKQFTIKDELKKRRIRQQLFNGVRCDQ